MFAIDDHSWPYPCGIERAAKVRASKISGMLLDRTYFNDVLGTYMQYTVSIAVPLNDRDAYTDIYELLTDPVDGHRFSLPYNRGTLQVTARVESVPDSCVRLHSDGQYWHNIRFTLTANHPTKSLSLSQVLSRGRSPMPEITDPNEGDSFTWTDNHWEHAASYADADAISY